MKINNIDFEAIICDTVDSHEPYKGASSPMGQSYVSGPIVVTMWFDARQGHSIKYVTNESQSFIFDEVNQTFLKHLYRSLVDKYEKIKAGN